MNISIERLSFLVQALKNADTLAHKLECLYQDSLVKDYIKKQEVISQLLDRCVPQEVLIVLSIIAIGQAQQVFLEGVDWLKHTEDGMLDALIQCLIPVEHFYQELGGLVGYHFLLLNQMGLSGKSLKTDYSSFCEYANSFKGWELNKEAPQNFNPMREVVFIDTSRESDGNVEEKLTSPKTDSSSDLCIYHRPIGIDLFEYTQEVKDYVIAGIQALPLMAEIYPVGGAADRLRLCDEQTKTPLPAARLQFCGKSLLEWMVEDVQAREYLYYQLYGTQVTVPIAMMTSHEKDNHARILELCESNCWFGRTSDSFMLFCQPAVPTVNKNGDWCILGPCKPLMKPGGHGVIWKLAKDEGVFDWLDRLGKKKLIVRQINNPIAGCDYGLMAFTGIGCKDQRLFGFASCLREVNAAEGVNVLIESRRGADVQYCLTNIEYCDFSKMGIQDFPLEEGGSYSQFPSNTNLLFADIKSVSQVVSQCPIPGMIVNLKKMSFQDELGVVQEAEIARLESTMQNIADCFKGGSAFLTYNHRHKTISTIKKEWVEGSLLETAEGCGWDLYQNAEELLKNYCRFILPAFVSQKEYVRAGSAYQFLYHPALGPMYSIIAQKLRGGSFQRGSSLCLKIAQLDCEQLHLQGSLHIEAQQIMGDLDLNQHIRYSSRGGRCSLVNVRVMNNGLYQEAPAQYRLSTTENLEQCQIILCGNSEFEAQNLTIRGHFHVEVKDGYKIRAFESEGQICLEETLLDDKCWHWKYTINSVNEIILTKGLLKGYAPIC